MILNDKDLRIWAFDGGINPFESSLVGPASIDLRLGDEFLIDGRRKTTADQYLLEPHSFVLTTTFEYVGIPDNMRGVIYLKSSAARAGLNHALAGFIDPGFQGQITLEFSTTANPFLLKAGECYVQLELALLTAPATKPYRGKYQGQIGVTGAL